MVLQGTLHTVNHHYTMDQVGNELLTGTRLLRQMSQEPGQRTNAAFFSSRAIDAPYPYFGFPYAPIGRGCASCVATVPESGYR